MFDRFLFYVSYVFYATAVMVILFMFYTLANLPDFLHDIDIKSLVGVAIIYSGIYCIFHTQIKDEYSRQLGRLTAHIAGGFGLMILNIFLPLIEPNPLTNYVTIRTADDYGYVLSGEIYHKGASVPKGSYIHRYNYSPRKGKLLGANVYEFPYEVRNENPIKFGILVTCEAFAYYAIMLTPLILCCAYYEKKKEKPGPNYSARDLRVYSVLLVPFILGLSPLLNVINPTP